MDLLDMAIPVLGLLGMEAVAFALRAVGLDSTAQVTFPPRVFSHLITSQALALAFADLLSEDSHCLRMVSAPCGIPTSPPTSRIDR